MAKALPTFSTMIAAALLCLTAARPALAQESDTLTAEQEASASSQTLPAASPAPASAAAAADDAATQTVVLIGEKVSTIDPTSAKGPFPDLVSFTTATLGGKVTDLTQHGETVAKTAARLKEITSAKPDIVIMFTGYSDEKSETRDEDIRKSLTELTVSLKKSGARVILVPASTEVGALAGANLRLVASDVGVSFVAMGTEVSGQPFQEAFDGIQAELAGPAPEAAPPPPVQAKSVTISGNKIVAPGAAPTPALTSAQMKANLQAELDRVAGESGEAARSADTTTTKIYTDAGTTGTAAGYPEGGTLTKRGKEAQESINMRPLPAVKAFRPQIPVPRNEIEKKEPGLSR